MQTGEAVLALGAVAGLLAIGYYYIVTKSPFAKKAPKNSAFVFIKPHANTGEVQALAQKTFAEKGIKVLSSGELTAKEIDEKKLMLESFAPARDRFLERSVARLFVPIHQARPPRRSTSRRCLTSCARADVSACRRIHRCCPEQT